MRAISAENETAERELIGFLSTEHSVMQSMLSGTISESGSRMTSFLAALSGGVVALAFVGQISGFSDAFRIFALVLLPTLLFLGLVAFERLLQLFLEETILLRGMNRIRRFFVERRPEAAPWVMLSTYDDLTGVSRSRGNYDTRPRSGARQVLITNPGTVAVIDGVLAARPSRSFAAS